MSAPQWPDEVDLAPAGRPLRCALYGLHLDGQIKLPVPESAPGGPADLEVRVADMERIDRLCDGATLLPGGGA